MLNLTIVAILCFAATSALTATGGLLVADLRRRRGDRLERRLLVDVDSSLALSRATIEDEPANRFDRAFVELVDQSGVGLSMSQALSLVAGSAVVFCAVPLVFFENFLLAALGLVLGAVWPIGWFLLRRFRRRRAMRMHLSETLELLADGVRSGRTLEQASELVAAESPWPLNEEFGCAASQLKLGHTPVAVLDRMVRRVPMPEFRIFATAVLVHRTAGGNLATLIERLAVAARDRHEFFGHLKAVTSGSMLSAMGLVIGSIVAVGLLSWMQPEYLEMFLKHPWGVPLLGIAGALQLIGMVWVWRVLRMNY
ncbi:MAG: type II secretion system F family protein [Pirellulales bacterium]|nr:type II secretion system F family protein [Pirellulales bacterium]